jgi:hypothetical protein
MKLPTLVHPWYRQLISSCCQFEILQPGITVLARRDSPMESPSNPKHMPWGDVSSLTRMEWDAGRASIANERWPPANAARLDKLCADARPHAKLAGVP